MDSETIQRRRWAILGVLVVCLLVVILDNTILNVALKTIQQDLSASQSQMQWAVDSYSLVFAGLLIPFGVLGDRIGRKRILLGGLLMFGAMSALTAFAQNPTELIIFRGLMGIGAAAVQPQTLSIIQNVFEPEERGKAIGIWAGAAGLGIAIGPLAGGALLKYFWWGSVFLVNVPLVVVGVLAIAMVVPDSKDPRPGHLDPTGILLSMAGLGVLVYGIIEGGNSNDWLRWNSLGAIVLGVLLMVAFVQLERRSSHPTIDMSLFKNRQFASGGLVIALAFFALQGATFYLAYYLQAIRGYTALAAGVALIAVAAGQMIGAPQSSRLSARFGARNVIGSGLLLVAASMTGYGFAKESTPQWMIEVLMFCLGFGLGITMAPATTAIMSAVPREKAGAGSAVNNTVRQVAGALGVAVLGSLLAVVFRNHLGTATPQQVAQRLDQPASVVQQLPAGQQVAPLVHKDTSESIGAALEFVQSAGKALQSRGAAAAQPPTGQQQRQATAVLTGFVQQSKDSFVHAMNVTSRYAAVIALLGSIIGFVFLPGRRRSAAGSHEAGSHQQDDIPAAELVAGQQP
ncbi:MAG TPA: MFS transporter [Jatrophihabitans sp.]|nr:MFS transporter [Jatrophihabitans sp.]